MIIITGNTFNDSSTAVNFMDSYLRDIIDHLGPKSLELIGAKNITPKEDTERSITFQIKENEKGITHIKIKYVKAWDTYILYFYSLKGESLEEKAKAENVYSLELHRTITEHTGLKTE